MKIALPGLFAAATALGVALAAGRGVAPPEPLIRHRPIERPTDGYVSSDSCRACHPSQFASWSASYHRTMTQVATPESVVADFDRQTIGDVHGAPMRLERTGGGFWAEFDDPDAATAGARIRREVVMITGSHHQQIYWYATGKDRLLGQLPGAYLIAERRWIPRRLAVLHPPSDPVFSETGHWNSTCIACHTTSGRPALDTPLGTVPALEQRADTTVAEMGIGCEACHGPSADHVRANRNPLRRYGLHFAAPEEPADSTVVQPLRLDPQRASQVCGQCHGVWEFYDAAGERLANSRGLPYRPGDELRNTRFVAQPTTNGNSPPMRALLDSDAGFVRDSFWPDGLVRVSGREYNGLIESPCFKNASDPARTMTCMSCHTMHKPDADPRPLEAWRTDQLGAGMEGNGACLGCHTELRDDISAHTRHAVNSSGSSCYNCHMPYTTYGLLKTIRSHTISSPGVAESVDSGRPNACNLCHVDRTLAWTGEALERWYGVPQRELNQDQRTVSAMLLWLLRGDAGQRAIAAAALGWAPAQQASGVDWMPPYLAETLNDPYDAVRFIAARSLRSLPGFARIDYDFLDAPNRRYQAQLATMRVWESSRPRPPRSDAQLLFDGRGGVDAARVMALVKARDNRRVLLRE